MVRRIVDATLDGGASTSPATASAIVPATGAAPTMPATGATPGVAPPAGAVTIAVGADHGGSALKDRIGQMLTEAGFAVHDCGTHGSEPVDYPDIAHAVARLVADGTCRWGIIVDGAGIGSCMVANKVPGVRAALCVDAFGARISRLANNAKVLVLSMRLCGDMLAREIIDEWLATAPSTEPHRVAFHRKVDELDAHYRRRPQAEP